MRIDVTTGARLHLGLICGTPGSPWNFGGIGLMLREPSWHLTVDLREPPLDADLIHADAESASRLKEFLQTLRQSRTLPHLSVAVRREIPFHCGLGAGTQLALAIAVAGEFLTKSAGAAMNVDPSELAALVDRCERSAVGTYGFRHGGFLVDHGISVDNSERIVERIAMPESWRIVLLRPEASQGCCGEQERTFFRRSPSMSLALVSRLTGLIEQHIVPSLNDNDFDLFATSVEEYGDLVGQFYAPEQGGVFAHHGIDTIVRGLRARGIFGAAQSSWGPGICIPARSEEHAADIISEIHRSNASEIAVKILITEPLNVGATIRTIVPDSRLV